MIRPFSTRLFALTMLFAAGCKSPRPTEFVNIVFTPSVDTDEYATWNFELDSCVDIVAPQVDTAFVRAQLLTAIREQLAGLDYEYQATGTPDFRVFYELSLKQTGERAERGIGRITVRDVATGRLVWRGERKRPVGDEGLSKEEQLREIELFAHELLQYTRKLEVEPQ